MFSKCIELKRGRKVTVELFEDGAIGLEVVKDASMPRKHGYVNGENDYHEVYMNLSAREMDMLVDLFMEMMAEREKYLDRLAVTK